MLLHIKCLMHFFETFRVVCLESYAVRADGNSGTEEGHDLYILAGHEASY